MSCLVAASFSIKAKQLGVKVMVRQNHLCTQLFVVLFVVIFKVSNPLSADQIQHDLDKYNDCVKVCEENQISMTKILTESRTQKCKKQQENGDCYFLEETSKKRTVFSAKDIENYTENCMKKCLYDSEVGSLKSVTDWGDWTKPKYCPDGQYMCGLEQKIEPFRGSGLDGGADDSGMNAVRFFCSSIDQNKEPCSGTNGVELEQLTKWGEWTGMGYCPSGMYVFGLEQRVEPPQGVNYDDAAMTALRFYCRSFDQQDRIITRVDLNEKENVDWGEWTGPEFCPELQYMYGLEQRVEPPQGDGDDTAMNAVRFFCRSFE